MQNDRMFSIVQDAIAAKRVIKWGYVRAIGGIYPSQCDSVASHLGSVTAMVTVFASEFASEIESRSGAKLSVETAILMSIIHDLGESRSGDTGASSHGIRGYCDLHTLEREGLDVTLKGFRLHDRALELFDDYRAYRTPEALLVHVCDNIEGFEKGLHAAGSNISIQRHAEKILQENLLIYRDRKNFDPKLGHVAGFLVDSLLIPAIEQICATYEVKLSKPLQ